MKPKPFSPLNHLTVPCAMKYLLASRGRTSRLSTAVERQTLPTPTQNSRERSTDHDTRLATAPQVCHIFLRSLVRSIVAGRFSRCRPHLTAVDREVDIHRRRRSPAL